MLIRRPELAPARPVLERRRASWCYGTPGIARALHLAGVALGEDAWVHDAAEAMRAVFAHLDGCGGSTTPGCAMASPGWRGSPGAWPTSWTIRPVIFRSLEE
nr:lanthionine synthetase LanC family protein [Streptomyces sabulosicollis]